MYNATNVFDNTVRGNDRKFIVKIKCGKNESTDAIKSLKQYSQLPSDSLTIGGAFPSTLELTLWNPGFSLQNKEFQVELGLEIEDGTTEWCPMGYYTSETFKESSDGMITITAYDRIYSKMSGAYFSKLTYPADAIDILNEISQKTGVEIQTANLTNGVKIQKRKVVSNKEIDENGSIEQVTTYENPFDGYTYREALGYIAMLFCKYAIADRNGSVKFVWFNEVENYKVTADYYYELTTNETAFSVGKITCNTGEKELEVGSGTNNIQLSNPIMTQERLNYIYEVVKTLTFIPSYFPFYGDMRLDIGDVIKVVKTDGSIYSVPIMSVTQEFDGGLRTSVQSFGGLEQEVETKGPLATRLERQYTELLLVKELVGEKASFDNLYALSGEFGSLKADYGEFEKLVTEDFKTVNADIINLKSNSITTDNLDAKLAEIGALTAETADLKYATIVDLNALNGKFEELSAESITTGNLSASVANLGYLKTDEADIKYAKIETLETEYLQLKNLSAETAKLGYLTAIEADIGYAKIDFSNVGKQVVSSSMIMDSAVTNEKVANLSANKITSGTIDASMIRVINLNADNLTVGTINGKLIGNGSVDLDRLSEEVPTKEYLDGELSSLKAKTTTLETSVGNKVEKSVFNELKQTVEENSSKIVSLTTTVSKKADSSTVTTLTNNVNEIRQTATQNTASISGMKADIEKKADGSTVSSLATKVSSVEQNLDGFKTTVSNTYTTKEDFNALEIGGRNLARNTENSRTWKSTSTYGNDTWSGSDGGAGWLPKIKIEPNQDYTLSFDYTLENVPDSDKNNIGCGIGAGTDDLSYARDLWNDQAVYATYGNGASAGKFIYHLSAKSESSLGSNKYFAFRPIRRSGSTTLSTPITINIKNFKLEKGTKATDWTPAPEDVQNGIDSASKTATNYLNFSNGGLVIGNLTASTLGRNVLIDSDSVDIRNGTTVLATFAENLIELGKNSTASVIKLCGGAGQFSTKTLLYDGVSYSTLTLYSNNGIELQANNGSMIHQQVSGGGLKNETYMFTDSTLFTKNIELEKGVKIRSYADDILIDLVRTSGSNVIFGNGVLDGASVVGVTSLRGYDINFMVGSTDVEYKPYHSADADDGVSDTWMVDGIISASALRVYFTIPLGKPIIGNPTVTVSSMNGLLVRQNGSYIYGSASSTWVKPSKYVASIAGDNCIHIIAYFDDKTNAVNNYPCTVNASIAIEFG